MKSSWNPEIEIIHAPTQPDAFNQALDEWAILVYDYLCQLETQNQIQASPCLTAANGETKDEEADVA